MSSALLMFVPTAISAIMSKLAPRIERAAGSSITQSVDLNPAISQRIASGEGYDLGLTNPFYVNALIESGHADGASHRAFGRVPLAIGRRTDTMSSVEPDHQAVVDVLRTADSIAYTGSGTSGRIFMAAAERLGVADAIRSKSRDMPGGMPVQVVTAGEVEIAVAPLTTVLATPGVVPAAVFPEELGAHIDISVFLSPSPKEGAEGILSFLTTSELDAELLEAGISRFDLPTAD